MYISMYTVGDKPMNTTLNIRPANSGDIERISATTNKHTKALKESIGKKEVQILEDGYNQILGYIILTTTTYSVRIDKFGIVKSGSPNIVLREFVKNLKKTVDNKNKNAIIALVPEKQLPVQQVLQSEGFCGIKALRNYFDKEDAFIMVYRCHLQ